MYKKGKKTRYRIRKVRIFVRPPKGQVATIREKL